MTRPQCTGQLTTVVLFPGGVKEIFSPSKDLVWLWDLHSTLFNKYQGLFSWEKSSQGVKPTTQLHTVRGLRMSGNITPLHHMPSWHSQALSFTINRLDSIHILKTLNSSEMLEINCTSARVHTHTQFMPTEEFTTYRYMNTSNHKQAGLVLCHFFLCNLILMLLENLHHICNLHKIFWFSVIWHTRSVAALVVLEASRK